MTENNQKGWHRSYSVCWESICRKISYDMQKDEILKCRFKKKRVKDYFATEENFDDKKILPYPPNIEPPPPIYFSLPY